MLPEYLNALPDHSYAILQLTSEDKNAKKLFASTKELARMELCPDIADYALVYTGKAVAFDDDFLETVYMAFNIAPPEGFAGHSLSVSDIVAIKDAGQLTCYYVDSIGFKKLTDLLSSV